jgi:hypothetical protein
MTTRHNTNKYTGIAAFAASLAIAFFLVTDTPSSKLELTFGIVACMAMAYLGIILTSRKAK